MQQPDRTTADADQRQHSGSRWTARIENGEVVYEQSNGDIRTTDTEYVAERTRPNSAGGQA